MELLGTLVWGSFFGDRHEECMGLLLRRTLERLDEIKPQYDELIPLKMRFPFNEYYKM